MDQLQAATLSCLRYQPMTILMNMLNPFAAFIRALIGIVDTADQWQIYLQLFTRPCLSYLRKAQASHSYA